MGLVRLLFEELPEISRQAEAVGNLAFNVNSDNSTIAYSCSSVSTEFDIQHQQSTQATSGSHHRISPSASSNRNPWHQLL
jgi:hypothetical protein